MKLLVTGGAGYIGSHAVRRLREAGHEVVVLDDLSRGNRAAVPAEVPLHVLDVADRPAVERLLNAERIECVLHFAALAYVGESVERPLPYYRTNFCGGLALLEAVAAAGVRKFVFSSTCATYGVPDRLPLTEDQPCRPINPYGRSKLLFEQALYDHAATAPDFAFVALRYFNVAGASLDGSLGEDHRPETHLIPNVLLAGLGRRPGIILTGSDYPTPDGTCIRDYIHVEDIVRAHVEALPLLRPGQAASFNLGCGRGFSNLEIVHAAERLLGRPISVEFAPRRPGDPPVLFAAAERFRAAVGWEPRHSDLDTILRTAADWFRRHPEGYGSAV